MRFQRQFSRRLHFGTGIALAGYSAKSGSGITPSMSSISNTEIINIPETKLNGPKFQPKNPPKEL